MEQKKIMAVTEWPTPCTVKEVQQFIGFVNFYQRFIPHFSTIAKPLTSLTQKGKEWEWDDSCQKAFQDLKRAITSDPVLAHPRDNEQYVLETNASGVAMGAVLSQRQSDS